MVSAIVPSQSKTRPWTVESMGSFMGGGHGKCAGAGVQREWASRHDWVAPVSC
jgi:hypothetical protein